MDLGSEINENIKSSIKKKLQELGSYIDDELPEYIMVMIANKRSQYQMTEDLSLFLGDETQTFVMWVFEMMDKLLGVMKEPADKSLADELAAMKDADNSSRDKEISQPSSNSDKSGRREKHKEGNESNRSSKHVRKRRHQSDIAREEDGDETAHGALRSKVEVQTRKSLLPAAKQATGALLRRAMDEAKKSVSARVANEYNPADVDPESWSKDKENKKKQKTLYMERHRELRLMQEQNRSKSESGNENEQSDEEQADEKGGTVEDEGIELEVAENEFQEERRPDNADSGAQRRVVSHPGEKSRTIERQDSDERKNLEDKHRHRRERKRSKQTFFVTLDGVDSQLTQKYESDELQEKRRKKDVGEDLVIDMESGESRPSVHSRLQFVAPTFPSTSGFYQMPIQDTYNRDLQMGYPHGPHFDFQRQPLIMAPLPIPVQQDLRFQVRQQPSLDAYQAALAQQTAVVTRTIPAPSINRGPIASRISRPPTVEKVQIPLDNSTSDDDGEPMDVSVEESSANASSDVTDSSQQQLERCRFWPDCKNGDDCTFIHPSVPCKMFPACKFGNQCIFLHPMCKFDANCTNTKCHFTHTAKKRKPSFTVPHATPSTSAALPCKFYPNCTKPNCPFLHQSSKPCRYGTMCTNKACLFTHVAPKRGSRSMKWIAPTQNATASHISERPFAADDKAPTVDSAVIKEDLVLPSEHNTNEPEKITHSTAPIIEVEN